MKTKSPFDDRTLLIPGITPLVESGDPDGSILAALEEQTLCLPGELTRRSLLVLGFPGSGKTGRLVNRAVAAALRHPDTSVVVFAVQPGSLRQAVAAARHYRGKKARIELFNPGEASACTRYINPLAGIRSKSAAKDVARLLAHTPGPGSGDGSEFYFRHHAIQMIAAGILALRKASGCEGTLATLKDAFDAGGAALRELADAGDNAVLRSFADDVIAGHHNSQTTLTYAGNILSPWDDEDCRTATSRAELDFDDLLLDHPGLLVLSVNEEDIEKHAGLTSLVFRQLFAWIIRTARAHGGALPRHLFLFIDELPAAGRIPDFGTRLTATFRKSNVSVIAAAQCEAQLEAGYGNEAAGVLAGFGSRIYVPPVAPSDAERACGRAGLIEVCQATTGADGRLLGAQPQLRPLLVPVEINVPSHSELGPRILFMLADLPPFQGYLRGAWEIPDEARILQAADTLVPPARRRRRREELPF